jgi:hypothetical protein
MNIYLQVYGDDTFHALVRQKCMDYMQLESDFFMHFVEGDRPDFDRYESVYLYVASCMLVTGSLTLTTFIVDT